MSALRSVTIQPGCGESGVLLPGQRLRIVDVGGQQVFDIALSLRDDPSEYCDLNYSLFAVERWYLTVGDIVYSKRMRPLLTVGADTCRVHDWIGGYCSHDLNRFLGDDRPGCREVLESEMQEIDLDPGCLVPPSCVNPFMNLPHRADGSWPTLLPASKPGDYLEFRAEAPLVWVGSVCTMPPPVNGLPLTPIRVDAVETAVERRLRHDTGAHPTGALGSDGSTCQPASNIDHLPAPNIDQGRSATGGLIPGSGFGFALMALAAARSAAPAADLSCAS